MRKITAICSAMVLLVGLSLTIGIIQPTTAATWSPTAASAPTSFYEQTDPNVIFAGSWTNSTSSAYSGQSAKRSSISGASVTANFNGTRLSWVGMTSRMCGQARVTLDGGTPVLVNLFSNAATYQQVVYDTGTLPNGFHTVKIQVVGVPMLDLGIAYVVVDAFKVEGALGPAPATPPPSVTSTTALPTTTTVPKTTTTTTAPKPTTTTTAPGSTFNLQAAINACPSGGTVNIPAGTYTFNSCVTLKSGVSLRGAGVDKTILSMPSKSEYTNLLYGADVANVAIRDLTLASPSPSGRVLAMHFSRYANVTVERVKVTGCLYVLKADTQGSNLTVNDLTAQACGQMYIANLTGGVFTNLNLAMTKVGLDGSWHAIYICANNHHLHFTNVKASGSNSWTVQLWTDYGWDQPSDDITFDGLYTTGLPLVISSGFSNVTFKNLTAISTDPSYECVRLSDPYNVTIDGFTGKGGPMFLGRYTGWTTHDITLRNGSYTGNKLISDNGTWIKNLVVQNVTTGVTTP